MSRLVDDNNALKSFRDLDNLRLESAHVSRVLSCEHESIKRLCFCSLWHTAISSFPPLLSYPEGCNFIKSGSLPALVA